MLKKTNLRTLFRPNRINILCQLRFYFEDMSNISGRQRRTLYLGMTPRSYDASLCEDHADTLHVVACILERPSGMHAPVSIGESALPIKSPKAELRRGCNACASPSRVRFTESWKTAWAEVG